MSAFVCSLGISSKQFHRQFVNKRVSMRDIELYCSIIEWNGYGTSELCALCKLIHCITIPPRRVGKQQQHSLSLVRATA